MKLSEERTKRAGLAPENVHKNRNTDIIPSKAKFPSSVAQSLLFFCEILPRRYYFSLFTFADDRYRPILKSVMDGRTDYINAVIVTVKLFKFIMFLVI